MLTLAMGTFIYTNSHAQVVPGEDECKACAGQQEPVEDQECMNVDFGGFEGCLELIGGVCYNVGEEACE